MRVTGIGGVFIRARDADALRAWYRDRLGVTFDEAGAVTFNWREPGETVFSVFRRESEYLGEGPFMVNFRVEDLDRVLAELRAEGVTVLDRVEDVADGRFGWAVDPEGNRIELWQPPPGR